MNRVLIVDDEDIIRDMASKVLIDEGYEVVTAGDGQAALSRIRAGGIDLLLTDIKMPEMDGMELIREAKRLDPDLIYIIMTGYATVETARKAVKEGTYDYLLKPFDLAELRMAVSGAFQRRRLEEENARLKQLTGLFEVSQKLSATIEKEALSGLLLQASVAEAQAEWGEIWLADEGGKIRKAIAFGENSDHGRIMDEVAQKGEPLSLALDDGEGIFLPLKTGKRILGVMGLQKGGSGAGFSPGDRELLTLLANQAAISLENSHLFSNLQDAYLSTIKSLSLLLEASDPYLKGHSQRVTDLCLKLGEGLDLKEEDMELLRQAAPLHDIGKIGISKDILNKKDKLSPDDWRIIRSHPVIGDEVLEPIGFLGQARRIVRHHHEREDGEGYPDGLTGEELDLPTKIIVIADSYDAMASDRPYRTRLTKEKIIEEFKKGEGTHFDPRIVHSILEIIE